MHCQCCRKSISFPLLSQSIQVKSTAEQFAWRGKCADALHNVEFCSVEVYMAIEPGKLTATFIAHYEAVSFIFRHTTPFRVERTLARSCPRWHCSASLIPTPDQTPDRFTLTPHSLRSHHHIRTAQHGRHQTTDEDAIPPTTQAEYLQCSRTTDLDPSLPI